MDTATQASNARRFLDSIREQAEELKDLPDVHLAKLCDDLSAIDDSFPAAPEDCCPACGDAPDYCQGHGEIGDPLGYAILQQHEEGNHKACHPDADCED